MIDHSEVQSLVLRPAKADEVCVTFLTATGAGLQTLLGETLPGKDLAVTWADSEAPTRTRALGLTAEGLRILGISDRARAALPSAFLEGMAAASGRLGDGADPGGHDWDPPLGWRGTDGHTVDEPWAPPPIHAVLIEAAAEVGAAPVLPGGVKALPPSWTGKRRPGGIEPFGFRDDITNPVVAGGPNSADVRPGNGVWDAQLGRWRAIAPGELLLGHVDEIGTISGHPDAAHLERNGSYLVIRRLEQDVVGFWERCEQWAAELGWRDDDGEFDAVRVAAQLVGRQIDGTPLGREPGEEPINEFLYRDARFCPVAIPPSAHVRRANPRDSLEFSDKTVARHTLFRRGYPYGSPTRGPEGLLFMACCADLRRQFEFIQSTWLEDGDRFGLGVETDPIAGRRETFRPRDDRALVSIDDGAGTRLRTTFKSYVHLRGGEYVLLPSRSTLRLLAGAGATP